MFLRSAAGPLGRCATPRFRDAGQMGSAAILVAGRRPKLSGFSRRIRRAEPEIVGFAPSHYLGQFNSAGYTWRAARINLPRFFYRTWPATSPGGPFFLRPTLSASRSSDGTGLLALVKSYVHPIVMGRWHGNFAARPRSLRPLILQARHWPIWAGSLLPRGPWLRNGCDCRSAEMLGDCAAFCRFHNGLCDRRKRHTRHWAQRHNRERHFLAAWAGD